MRGLLWCSRRTYVVNCASVRPQYSLILAHVSVSAATCHHVQSATVSGAAVVGGSSGYAALSSGSKTRPRVRGESMVQVFRDVKCNIGREDVSKKSGPTEYLYT